MVRLLVNSRLLVVKFEFSAVSGGRDINVPKLCIVHESTVFWFCLLENVPSDTQSFSKIKFPIKAHSIGPFGVNWCV